MTTIDDVPLPPPWDYCYEWDGPYGTRKFSAAAHNGNKPTRSVPLFTEAQMRGYAVAWALEAMKPLQADAERYRWLKRNPQWLGWEHDFRPDEVEREIDAAMAAAPVLGAA